LRVRM